MDQVLAFYYNFPFFFKHFYFRRCSKELSHVVEFGLEPGSYVNFLEFHGRSIFHLGSSQNFMISVKV